MTLRGILEHDSHNFLNDLQSLSMWFIEVVSCAILTTFQVFATIASRTFRKCLRHNTHNLSSSIALWYSEPLDVFARVVFVTLSTHFQYDFHNCSIFLCTLLLVFNVASDHWVNNLLIPIARTYLVVFKLISDCMHVTFTLLFGYDLYDFVGSA